MKIVNIGQRKFTINDGQGVKTLAPLCELEVSEKIGKELVASFLNEIKVIEEIIPVQEVKKEEAAPVVVHSHKHKKKGA